jgi:hypothetical protein
MFSLRGLKIWSTLILLMLLTSCIPAGIIAVKKLLPSSYDDNEMLMISNLRYDVRQVQCTGDKSQETILKIWEGKEKLYYYSSAKENEDVLKMVRPLSESMRGLYESSKSGNMKELYCIEKVINLTKQVDIIANALAARNK